MKNIFRLLILLLVLSTSCRPQETEVVILSLNDLHAKIDNLDKVATYVAEQRAQHPNVLLLSAGDLFSGNPAVDYYHDKGYPIIDVMNDIRFDVSTIGNHEFDYGQTTLAQRIAQAKFPFVCANISTDSSPLTPFKPYVFFTKSGEKICVVGLIQEHPETHVDKIKKLHFTNPIDELEKYLSLRAQSDVLVALTHMGVQEDSLLAVRYKELDLIVGGHSHTQLDTGMLVNGVLVTQAAKYVQHIGRTTLTIRNGKVVAKRNRLVDVSQLTQKDTLISKKIKEYNSNPELSKVVATLKNAINNAIDIGNFFCDAVRAEINVDIAFQNRFGVRIDTLYSGAVTVSDLYRADPFGNEVIRFEMTGAEVAKFITDNYNTFQRLDLCASGISYKIFVREHQVESVSVIMANGQPLDGKKKYSVAMNSYMATAYRLPVKDKGVGVGKSTVEATIDYLSKHKAIAYPRQIRGVIKK
ncbi:MAG: bifunctional metallophosphatase/5'-nucleotidase [Prevotellaceae bacterium]|jgi:2',3'-cyclic-nucleotide 2'-phosphodiesterase (5'-nucleotidase family)|nr:bifunctional metallophosphatase/5'-nucleotidase [Prevotellaceae bacterium]